MTPALQGRDIPPGNYAAHMRTPALPTGQVVVHCPEHNWSAGRPTQAYAISALLAHRIRHHGHTITVPDLDWIVLDPQRGGR